MDEDHKRVKIGGVKLNKLISIIVPVYNVEKYLNQCIDSLINQTYRNFEIILIDDGSTDNSFAICERYKMNFPEFVFLYKQTNVGLSETRNRGIKYAKGDLITFVDSDDYLHPQFLEILVQPFENPSVEATICNHEKIHEYTKKNSTKHTLNDINYFLCSGKESLYPQYFNPIACSKIYNKKLFEDIVFPIGKIQEDVATTYKVLYKCNQVAITEEKLYFYVMSPESISRSSYSLKNLDIIAILEEKMDYLLRINEYKLYELEVKQYCSALLKHYYLVGKHLDNSEKIKEEIFRKFKKHYRKTLLSRHVKTSSKILMILCRIWPIVYGKVVVDKSLNNLKTKVVGN